MSKKNSQRLGELLRYAAHSLPDARFRRRGDEASGSVEMRVAELDERAERHRTLWRAAGLGEGARVGMIGTPEPEVVSAIVGAVRAGIEVVLLSPSLEAPAIAATVGLARAPALAGPADFAGIDFAKRLSEARAAAGGVAWLMLWEADRPRLFRLDNAQPIESSGGDDEPEAGLAAALETSVQALDGTRLRTVAGEFAEALGLSPSSDIISLVSPATPAGLIVSVHAPLRTGAQLTWQAPFSATELERAMRDHAPAHLVAPSAIAAELGRAGLFAADLLGSLTLIVSDRSPPPLMDADIDYDRVFFLDARLAGDAPFTRLSADFGAEDGDLV
jgi:acyl-CoA synthetase (AMP-forming)/AMP-acid ligase II